MRRSTYLAVTALLVVIGIVTDRVRATKEPGPPEWIQVSLSCTTSDGRQFRAHTTVRKDFDHFSYWQRLVDRLCSDDWLDDYGAWGGATTPSTEYVRVDFDGREIPNQ